MEKFGIGLDYKYLDRYNESIGAVVRESSKQLSHVSIVGIDNVEEAAKFKDMVPNLPVIHHLSGIAPCGLDGPDLSRMKELDTVSLALEAVWCGEDIGIWKIGKYDLPYFAPPLFTREIATFAAAGVREVQGLSSIPFLAEVPSVGSVIGDLALGDFFSILMDEGGCGIVADLSHIYSYALAKDKKWCEIVRSFPIAGVREIHIAGGRVSKRSPNRYVDSHSDAILPPILQMLEEIVPRAQNLEAITFEVGVNLDGDVFKRDFDRVARSLSKIGFECPICPNG